VRRGRNIAGSSIEEYAPQYPCAKKKKEKEIYARVKRFPISPVLKKKEKY
jgi:hypothetical protein